MSNDNSRDASRILSGAEDREEEDEELLEAVTETLERRGILGKLKAELRSNVYLAMENGDEALKRSRQCNSRLEDFISSSDGRLALHLVREFLQFFKLKWSLSVFDAEALDPSSPPRNREELTENMGLSSETAHLSKSPLLFEILRLSKVSVLRSETPTYQTTENSFSEETDIEEGALTPSPTKPDIISPLSHTQDLIRKELFSTASPQSNPLGDLPPLRSTLPKKTSLPSLNKQSPELIGKKDPFIHQKDPITHNKECPTTTTTTSSSSSSLPEEIEEDLDELLHSNMSEELTKDETLSKDSSPRVDYIESL